LRAYAKPFQLPDVEGEVVILAPHCQVTDLLPVGCLLIAGDQAYHSHVICKLGVRVVSGHAVVGEQGLQEGTINRPLWGPRVEGERGSPGSVRQGLLN
jgi:hypothetical protein